MRTSTQTQLIARTLVGGVLAGTLTLPAAAALATSHLTVVHENTPALEGHTVLVETAVSSTCTAAPVAFDCDDIVVSLAWRSIAGSASDTETLAPMGGSTTFQIPKEHVVEGLRYDLTVSQGSSSWTGSEEVDVRADSDPLTSVSDEVDGVVDEGLTTISDVPATVASLEQTAKRELDGGREKVEEAVNATREFAEREVAKARKTVEEAVNGTDVPATLATATGLVTSEARKLMDTYGSPGDHIDDLNGRIREGNVEQAIAGTLGDAETLRRAVTYNANRYGFDAARETLSLAQALQAAIAALGERVLPLVNEILAYADPFTGPVTTFVNNMVARTGGVLCALIPTDRRPDICG